MLTRASDDSPPLRDRSIRDNLRRTFAEGPVHRRATP
jgi:dihydroorotase-like cyclic amidohydrolase